MVTFCSLEIEFYVSYRITDEKSQPERGTMQSSNQDDESVVPPQVEQT